MIKSGQILLCRSVRSELFISLSSILILFKGIVHPKIQIVIIFSVRVYFFCWTQKKPFWKMLVNKQSKYYRSQWLPPAVWLPTFFKISPFVLNRRKKLVQVWNKWSVVKCLSTGLLVRLNMLRWINVSLSKFTNLICVQVCKGCCHYLRRYIRCVVYLRAELNWLWCSTVECRYI